MIHKEKIQKVSLINDLTIYYKDLHNCFFYSNEYGTIPWWCLKMQMRPYCACSSPSWSLPPSLSFRFIFLSRILMQTGMLQFSKFIWLDLQICLYWFINCYYDSSVLMFNYSMWSNIFGMIELNDLEKNNISYQIWGGFLKKDASPCGLGL